jgi:hypothetical protein
MAVIKIVPMPGAVGDKGDEGAVGPQGQQGPAGQNGLPGTPALWSYQGTYNSSAAYAVGDVVVYQGQLYYTKSVTTAGTLPTVTAKFDLIASKGADGQAGTNGSDGAPGAGFGIFYLGNYNPSSGYVPDIAVVRGSDGQLYLAKASGQLGDPVGNTAQWEVWIPKGADGTNGTNGTNGTDALWNFTGPWVNGIDYGPGSLVEFEGSTYYHPNGQFSSYAPPTNGWLLVAEKGEPGTDVFAEDGTLYGPTNFGGLKVLGLINSGDNDLALQANDADIYLQASSGAVTIAAPEVNIVSNVVPSSFNINTYLGASVNSNRTSTYAVEDKVVATLGDLTTLNFWNFTGDQGVPTEDGLLVVDGISGRSATGQGNVSIFAGPSASVVLAGNNGEFLKDTNIPANQIATIGDVEGQLNYWDGIDPPQDPAKDGFLIVDGLVTGLGSNLLLSASDRVFIGGNNGEFLNGSSAPENQIATIGDLPTGWTGTINANSPVLISVVNGIITEVNSLT